MPNPHLTRFHDAARAGDVATLESLRSLIPVDSWDHSTKHTALYYAILNRQLSAVDWLLDKGANPNHVCRGGTIVWHAVLYPKDSSQGHSPADAEILDLLLRYGSRPNAKDGRGGTALMRLVSNYKLSPSSYQMQQQLLSQQDIDLDCKEKYSGHTVLAMAAMRQSTEFAKALLLAGADPYVQMAWGKTAQDFAPNKAFGVLVAEVERFRLQEAVGYSAALRAAPARPRL